MSPIEDTTFVAFKNLKKKKTSLLSKSICFMLHLFHNSGQVALCFPKILLLPGAG